MTDRYAKILEILDRQGQLSSKKIMAALDTYTSRAELSQDLHDLRADGLIDRYTNSNWHITPAGRDRIEGSPREPDESEWSKSEMEKLADRHTSAPADNQAEPDPRDSGDNAIVTTGAQAQKAPAEPPKRGETRVTGTVFCGLQDLQVHIAKAAWDNTRLIIAPDGIRLTVRGGQFDIESQEELDAALRLIPKFKPGG